ncbi:MarR family winged helix-turn-helix transcriptional regulator [Devosia nitrariae]|uniref:Transcriptional regulator n=1 Tax=Devosia nitrariae TaxID=2071872 RepID=A0ABQ5W698_9HYPH|nr:MarR family transcriptional regulator [Devosia nitrariae]GLQ55584.1 transcriptional regulator [Devosia nitrariae]
MTELAELPGYLIRRLQQLAVSMFVTTMGEAGFDLTPVQFAAMTVIGQEPGIDQATLASRIAYDRATIGGVIARLCQKGYVARAIKPENRRARVLSLTTSGEQVLAQVTPMVMSVQTEILGDLTDSESAQFLDLLRKLVAGR